MTIRTFTAGDDAAQVSIYNEAAASLPKFKPATLDDVRRRCRAADFDPATRLFAVTNGRAVGYATFHLNGRVSYPWCRKGHEALAESLFEAVLTAMKERGLSSAFAAYRADWAPQRDFFLQHGFQPAREMVNFVMELTAMPTSSARAVRVVAPLRPEDVPAVFALAPSVLRVKTAAELEQHLLHNPYFAPESVFVLRNRNENQPLAVGVLVENATYANPKQVDAAMPCFRLGAFGTEGMTWKRINGLFSVLGSESRDLNPLALDLLGYASFRLHSTKVEALAAQAPSDAAHLMRFYKQYFREQGRFPIFERTL
jgi:hypothetical protein